MPPLVSVCIGTYNREKYVRECLESVLAQTYPNFEVVVVDDASTDSTLRILKEYEARIRLLTRSENSGVCQVTRNMASRAARGQYLAYLDSDDAWYPEKLEKQVAFMESHPEVPLSHTYCHVINERSEVIGTRHENNLPPTGPYFEALVDRCWITISSVMVRSDLFADVGYFNEDRFFRIGEDYEFFFRVARRHSIGLVPEVLGRYRKSEAGITAGNWTYTPRVVPLHRWLYHQPWLWKDIVPRRAVTRSLAMACLENCQFWRDRGYAQRALWFAWQGWLAETANGRIIRELAKSLACLFLRPAEMRRRRAGEGGGGKPETWNLKPET